MMKVRYKKHTSGIGQLLILITLVGFSSMNQLVSQTLAFPGAEGWGAMATSSCRLLLPRIRFVTNLNSSGAGSLREALENGVGDARYTFVIFRVGGIITDSRITTTGSCLYLAGQSAPGGGILHTGGLLYNTA